MIEQTMLIAGTQCQASNGATFDRLNPLDGSVATRAPAAMKPTLMPAAKKA